MTDNYELRTATHEYQYLTLDALFADLSRFEPDATISIYAYSGGSYDEPPTSAHQYNVGKGAWQQIVYSGTVAVLSAEQDCQALVTAPLGGR